MQTRSTLVFTSLGRFFPLPSP